MWNVPPHSFWWSSNQQSFSFSARLTADNVFMALVLVRGKISVRFQQSGKMPVSNKRLNWSRKFRAMESMRKRNILAEISSYARSWFPVSQYFNYLISSDGLSLTDLIKWGIEKAQRFRWGFLIEEPSRGMKIWTRERETRGPIDRWRKHDRLIHINLNQSPKPNNMYVQSENINSRTTKFNKYFSKSPWLGVLRSCF